MLLRRQGKAEHARVFRHRTRNGTENETTVVGYVVYATFRSVFFSDRTCVFSILTSSSCLHASTTHYCMELQVGNLYPYMSVSRLLTISVSPIKCFVPFLPISNIWCLADHFSPKYDPRFFSHQSSRRADGMAYPMAGPCSVWLS